MIVEIVATFGTFKARLDDSEISNPQDELLEDEGVVRLDVIRDDGSTSEVSCRCKNIIYVEVVEESEPEEEGQSEEEST